MKKDIEIPEVADLYLAAIREFNEELGSEVWNVYLINDRKLPLEMVLIVSRGASEDKKTSVIRRSIESMNPSSYARIEMMPDDLLSFKNEYLISFFEENRMYERKFVFNPNGISAKTTGLLPVMQKEGVLAI